MKKSTKIFISSVAASLIFIGCGGGSDSTSTTSAPTTGTVSGTAVDGPIYNAQVCLDLNFNKKCDTGESQYTTDENGRFSITYKLDEENASIAPVLIVSTLNSIDTSTGNPFTFTMSSPRAGQSSVVVSPLTTVAAEAVYQKVENNESITEETVKEVTAKVSEALDLNGTDITQVNPTEDPKLLVTAVTLASVIKDGNLSEVADNIVEQNETNITAALPDDYQSVYTAAVNAVSDENTSINPDLLQQAVETAIDNNDTNIVQTVVDSEGNETAVAEALVGGYLNSVKTDLNESGVTIDLNGNELNPDFNASKTALDLYNDYNITDVSSLNDKYNSEDLNTSEVNVTALLQTYNLLEKARAVLKDSGITRSLCYIDGLEQVYFDLNTGEKIDVPENTFNFKYNGISQVIAYDSDTVAVVSDSKIYIAGGPDGSKTYDNIKSFRDARYDTVIGVLANPENDLNASLVKSSYTVTYTVEGKTESTVYNVDPSNPVYALDALKFDDGVHYFINTTDMNNSDYISLSGYLATIDSNGSVTSLIPAKAEQYIQNADAVELAKNIFSSLRTQVNSIANADENGTLDMEADKFNDQLKDITFDNLDSSGNTLASLLGGIIDGDLSGVVEIDNPDLNRTFTLSTDDNLTYNYSVKDDLNGTVKEYTGTIVLNQPAPQDLNSSFDITMSINGQLPASDEEEAVQSIDTSMELKYDAGTYTFNLTVSKLNVTDEDKSLELDNVNIEAAGTDANLSDLKYVKLNSFTINGKAGDFEADGTVNVQYVQNQLLQSQSNDQAFAYYYTLQGYFVCLDNDGSEEYNMTLPNEINVTIDGNDYSLPVVPSYGQNGEYWYNIYTTISTPDELDLENAFYALDTAVSQQVTCNDANYTAHIYNSYGQTMWVEKNDKFYNDGWVPNSITFNGNVKDTVTGTSLSGTINASSDDIGSVDLNNTEIINSEISLAVKLIRTDFADTNVNSTFTSSIDGSTALDISYSVDGTTFGTVTLSGKWDKDGNGTVSLTSTSGLKATIPVVKGDIDYTNPIPVYVTDKVVGYIEQRDDAPVIKYNDGTFESIN